MPVAAVGAAATVGVGYLQHRSASNAQKSTDAATKAALAHQTEREHVSDSRYDQEEENYQRDLAEWKARHGYGPAPGSGSRPRADVSSGGGTLRDLASNPYGPEGKYNSEPVDANTMPGAMGGTAQTLQDLARWNQWPSDEALTSQADFQRRGL